jgi:hypothetical protein
MERPLTLLVLALLPACEKSGPLADLDVGAAPASTPSTPAASAAPTPSAQATVRDAGRVMPPRPVPTSTPTVTIGMPEQVQLQAIQYMEAMKAPQSYDAPADAAYGKQIADSMRSMGKVDVLESGRQIMVTLPKGCDATFPKSAAGRSSAASLGVMLANGVLVVGCTDKSVQCLQSTRDASDVLCVHR